VLEGVIGAFESAAHRAFSTTRKQSLMSALSMMPEYNAARERENFRSLGFAAYKWAVVDHFIASTSRSEDLQSRITQLISAKTRNDIQRALFHQLPAAVESTDDALLMLCGATVADGASATVIVALDLLWPGLAPPEKPAAQASAIGRRPPRFTWKSR